MIPLLILFLFASAAVVFALDVLSVIGGKLMAVGLCFISLGLMLWMYELIHLKVFPVSI